MTRPTFAFVLCAATLAVGSRLPAQEAGRAKAVSLYEASEAVASAEHGSIRQAVLSWLPTDLTDVALPSMPSLTAPGGVRIGGWLQQGFTWNPDSPDNRLNGPNLLNYRSNEYLLNQLYLYIERPVNKEGGIWDIGGRVGLLYGTDYAFVAVPGLELEQDGTHRWNSDSHTTYGLAMPELYVETFVPIGGGLTVKAGHFFTITGYEVIAAPGNFFYSHTYTFSYGEPFTHTGALASYQLTPDIVIHSGLTLGADNFDNPNDNLGYLGGIEWNLSPSTSVAFVVHWAEQSFGGRRFENSAEYIQTFVLKHEIAPGLRYVFQSDFGYGEDQAMVSWGQLGHAEWYGMVHYLFYDISPCVTLGARFEWFRDEDNARIAGLDFLLDGDEYFNFTVGLNWKPVDWIIVRPELRWDWSDVDSPYISGFRGMYDDLSDKNQFTGAVDVVITY